MPTLSDERHERFAQGVVRGLPRGQSYLDAGFHAKNLESAAVQASKLVKKHPEITDRIDELHTEARTIILNAEFKGSIEELARLLLEDREFARQQKQAGAAVSASSALMRLFGEDKQRLEGNLNLTQIERRIVETGN